MSDAIKTVRDVRHQRAMIEHEVDAFLRRSGWEHTCMTPGSYWMWEREIEGRRVLVSKEHALAMQADFDLEPTDDEPYSDRREDDSDDPKCEACGSPVADDEQRRFDPEESKEP